MPKSIGNGSFNPSPSIGTKPIDKSDLMENNLKSPEDILKQNSMQIKKEWIIAGIILYCFFK